jgi:hypothetical protein
MRMAGKPLTCFDDFPMYILNASLVWYFSSKRPFSSRPSHDYWMVFSSRPSPGSWVKGLRSLNGWIVSLHANS